MARGSDPAGVRRRGPQHVGGVSDSRGNQSQRRQRGRLSRSDVHDGIDSEAWQRRAEARLPAANSVGRIAPPINWHHRTRCGLGNAPHQDFCAPRRRRLRDQRSEDFTSRYQHSDMLLLLTRTTPYEQVQKKTDGMSLFLLDIKESGSALAAVPIATMVNHGTNQLFIDNLVVPREALVGEEGKGFSYLLSSLNAERILVASQSIGDGRWFVEYATQYGNQRRVFDRPITMNQGVQFPIAKAHIAVQAADLMRFKAAARFDAGLPCGGEAMAKYLASE